MPDFKDFLPPLPWEGPPLPKYFHGNSRKLRDKLVEAGWGELEDRGFYLDYAKEAVELGLPEVAHTLEAIAGDEERHNRLIVEIIEKYFLEE